MKTVIINSYGKNRVRHYRSRWERHFRYKIYKDSMSQRKCYGRYEIENEIALLEEKICYFSYSDTGLMHWHLDDANFSHSPSQLAAEQNQSAVKAAVQDAVCGTFWLIIQRLHSCFWLGYEEPEGFFFFGPLCLTPLTGPCNIFIKHPLTDLQYLYNHFETHLKCREHFLMSPWKKSIHLSLSGYCLS